jgi:Protein of unknown function (DUF3500)
MPTTSAPPLRIEAAKDSDATGKTVAAARAFLATLDDAGRANVSFAFDDNQQKAKWSNFPAGMFERNGLRIGDLKPAQREAVMTLLAVALSKQGLQKVKDIMEGDEALRTGGMGGGRPNFSRDEYYLALLGAPSLTEPWMIQFGGHHLAINVTIAGKANVLTPSLPAAQPATFKLNGQTIRPLGDEYDKGFVLINALDAEQQKQAILPYQVRNLVLGAGEDGKTIAPEGIKVSALNPAQQEKLWDVVSEWVGTLNDEAAAAKMAEIKANRSETWFAWSGPVTPMRLKPCFARNIPATSRAFRHQASLISRSCASCRRFCLSAATHSRGEARAQVSIIPRLIRSMPMTLRVPNVPSIPGRPPQNSSFALGHQPTNSSNRIRAGDRPARGAKTRAPHRKSLSTSRCRSDKAAARVQVCVGGTNDDQPV